MGIQDKQERKLIELAQTHVAAPVEVAAIVLRKGETASRTVGSFAPGASLGKWAESIERAPDFPGNTLIAVTGTAMHLFEAKGGFSWKIKRLIGEWPFGSFRAVDAGTGRLTRFLTLTFADGRSAELEIQVSGAQRWQGALIDALVARSGAELAGD